MEGEPSPPRRTYQRAIGAQAEPAQCLKHAPQTRSVPIRVLHPGFVSDGLRVPMHTCVSQADTEAKGHYTKSGLFIPAGAPNPKGKRCGPFLPSALRLADLITAPPVRHSDAPPLRPPDETHRQHSTMSRRVGGAFHCTVLGPRPADPVSQGGP